MPEEKKLPKMVMQSLRGSVLSYKDINLTLDDKKLLGLFDVLSGFYPPEVAVVTAAAQLREYSAASEMVAAMRTPLEDVAKLAKAHVEAWREVSEQRERRRERWGYEERTGAHLTKELSHLLSSANPQRVVEAIEKIVQTRLDESSRPSSFPTPPAPFQVPNDLGVTIGTVIERTEKLLQPYIGQLAASRGHLVRYVWKIAQSEGIFDGTEQ